jgi:hypothetical protein
MFLGAQIRVLLGQVAGVRGYVVARRRERVDAAGMKGGQVRTPGRNQLRFPFS